jgi:hypothetical protein
MKEQVDEIYNKALETLKARPDFKSIDLTMVRVWATGYFIQSLPTDRADPETLELLNGIKEFLNDMAEILGLPLLK